MNTISEAAGPVESTERILLIDVLRGFALFGILQINWGMNYLPAGAVRSTLNFFF